MNKLIFMEIQMQLWVSAKLFVAVVFLGVVMTIPVAGMGSDTIKLGVAGVQSGDLASYGLPTVNAAELVVAQVNAKGGINGKKVELIVEDDKCKPEVAVDVATKLVSDGVDVVLGHTCSGATRSALPVYKKAGVVVMSPSATNPTLTHSGEYPNFFRTIPPDDAQAKTEVDFAVNSIGAKKVAVVHDRGYYGKGLAEFVKKFVEDSGKAEVVLFEGVPSNGVDYTAIVQEIKSKGADTVFLSGHYPEASEIISMMGKQQLKAVLISDNGVDNDAFIKVAGKNAEGIYSSGTADNSGNPLSIAAVEAHKTAYNSEPGAFFHEAYSATLALLNAIKKAGSTDMAAVVKVLQNEKFDTPVGTIYFDVKGDAVGVGFAVYQVRNGRYVEVK